MLLQVFLTGDSVVTSIVNRCEVVTSICNNLPLLNRGDNGAVTNFLLQEVTYPHYLASFIFFR